MVHGAYVAWLWSDNRDAGICVRARLCVKMKKMMEQSMMLMLSLMRLMLLLLMTTKTRKNVL